MTLRGGALQRDVHGNEIVFPRGRIFLQAVPAASAASFSVQASG
jgi:hypothetical protein